MRFFHSSASTRKKTNKITQLIKNNGERVEDHEGLCAIVRDYFSESFEGNSENVDAEFIVGKRTVSVEQNLKLVEEFTFEEFTLAIKDMHPDKASGLDGLNPAFFQSFWSVMGQEVFEYCKSLLCSKTFPEELNNTNVVLIPYERKCFLYERY